MVIMLSVTGVAVTVATPLPEPNTKKAEEGFSLLMVGCEQGCF